MQATIPAIPVLSVPPAMPVIPAPNYALYDQQAVAGATFLGSPVAGSILLALNYRRLGRSGAAVMSVGLGALATIALMFIGFSLPSKAPWAVVAALPMLLMMMLAKKLQGPAVEAHKKAGGPPCPRLKAAGVGLACLAVILGIVAAIYFVRMSHLGTKVIIGTKDEIYYSGAATSEQALALGQALKTEGYFSDKGVTVTLSKTDAETTLGLVMADGAWDKPTTDALVEVMTRKIAPSIGGLPVKVKLMNGDMDVKKELTVK